MATTLLVAGSTLTFWIPSQTPFASTSSYSSVVVQSARLSWPPCRRLNYGSFQLTHVTWRPRCSIVQVRASHGSQNKDKTLLQHPQRCHKGEFRQVSISARQWSLRCGQNLRGHFLRATLPMTVGSCARAMADNGETKGLITPPPGEFLHNYFTFESLHDSDHEGVVRIFVALSCKLGSLII